MSGATDGLREIVAARSLSKSYKEHVALASLDLSVGSGEVVCLLGANGAGKTTALHLLLGFIKPTSGSARIGGIDVGTDGDSARALAGYLPETVELYPKLNALETLTYFDDMGGRASELACREEALLRVGLPRDAHRRRVETYSKGMRQKLGLALALSKGARALLLDEPLSGLDPTAANELVNLLQQLRTDGVATLMVTHDIFRAHQIADRIGIMRRGRLVEEVKARDLTAAETERLYIHHIRDVE